MIQYPYSSEYKSTNYVSVPIANGNETFTVNSRYRIIRKVGSGAYGTVCSALDVRDQSYCAIKKIYRVFDRQLITKRCLREIKLLRLFNNHPRIIKLLDMDHIPGSQEIYLVFNCMDASLHDVIHSNQPLEIVHTQWFLYQLLSGIKYIHSANVIHRDLKPANILVNQDCDIRICDFGMSRSLSQSSSDFYLTEYVTTRWYRAPEIMIGHQNYSKAIDIWSIGCIFAEILGRKVLFQGTDYVDQLYKILGVLGMPKDISFWDASEYIMSHLQHLCTVDGAPPPTESIDFKILFPNASLEAIDILTQLLDLNPYKRITVEEAIQHSFINCFRDPVEESLTPPLSNVSPCHYNFEQTNNINYLKEMIIDEISSFKHEQIVQTDTITKKRHYTMAIMEQDTNSGTYLQSCITPTHKLNHLPSATMSIIDQHSNHDSNETILLNDKEGDQLLVGEPEELDEDENYSYLCQIVKSTPGVLLDNSNRQLSLSKEARQSLERSLSGNW